MNNKIEEISKRIQYSADQIKKSSRVLNTAKNILDFEENEEDTDYISINNRAYYSIFYSINSVLAVDGIECHKHKDAIAIFNQYYVHAGLFSKEFGRKISVSKDLREESDYTMLFNVVRRRQRRSFGNYKCC